jgi:nucleoside-diphosphate-sugar epimerase
VTSDVLLVGCGDLGSAVGLRLADRGHDVLALRRNADRVPAPLRGRSVDLTREAPDLQGVRARLLVVALTARPRSEEAYRATYVEGMGRLLAAEELFGERLPDGTVLRLSGLYGGSSTRLLDQVLAGRVEDPHRWTNRIHRLDAADAVVHLLTRPELPERLYLGTDDEPAQLGDVTAFLAERLGAPTPPAADPARGHGKRLSNARLRATGWRPSRPSYREGYADLRPPTA